VSDTRILDYARAHTAHKLVGQAVAQLQIARAEISVIEGEASEGVAIANAALAAARDLYATLGNIQARRLRAAERAT
jgi:hypothetical protein